jgi:hypothetical protein
MDTNQKRILVWFGIMLIIIISGALSACAPITNSSWIKPKAIEDTALEKAIIMCEKFGHMKGTEDFTKCAEKRFDEYILNNR